MSSIYVVSRDGQSLEKYRQKTDYAVVERHSYNIFVRTSVHGGEGRLSGCDVVIGTATTLHIAEEMAKAATAAEVERARLIVGNYVPGTTVTAAFRRAKRILEGSGAIFQVVSLSDHPVLGWYVDHPIEGMSTMKFMDGDVRRQETKKIHEFFLEVEGSE